MLIGDHMNNFLLDECPVAGGSISTNGPSNSAKAPSTSRMATTASCKLETHEEPAAACEPLAAQDEGIEQRTIHLVYVGSALQAR